MRTGTVRDSAFIAAAVEALTSRLRTNTARDAAFIMAEVLLLTRPVLTNTAQDSVFIAAEIEALTMFDPPATPSAPFTVSRTTNSLTLQVAAVAGATSYRWRYSLDSTVSRLADPMVTSTGTEVTITGLEPGADYWVDVRAENDAGQTPPI